MARVGGTWQQIIPNARRGGSWRAANAVWVRRAGSWAQVFQPDDPGLSGTWGWYNGQENVVGASGTTAHGFSGEASGGAGGPYTFVLTKVDGSPKLGILSTTAGNSPITYSGLAVGELLYMTVTCVLYDHLGNSKPAGSATVYVKRVS